jgi:hypothetical protein
MVVSRSVDGSVRPGIRVGGTFSKRIFAAQVLCTTVNSEDDKNSRHGMCFRSEALQPRNNTPMGSLSQAKASDLL